MLITDRLTLDAPRRTSDGYLAVRAKAARTGVYDYLASEVGAPADKFKPTDSVKVYRDAADVFAAESVRSFIGRPITNDHPAQAVTAANWRDHARGVVMGAMRDGDYLAFDLTLFDAAAIKAVEDGKRELSNGYACQLDWTPGTAPDGTAYDARQHSISGNHVALVDAGRAGPNCAIKDGDRFALCDANPAALDGIRKEKNVKTITLDGLPVNLGDEAAVEAAIAKLQGQVTDAQAQVATLTTDKSALEAKVTTLEKQVADAKLTPQQLQDAAKAYAAVCDKAKALGVAVTDSMDQAAVMKAVVDKHLGDAAKEWTDAQIASSFAALTLGTKAADATVVNINPAQNVGDSGAAVRNLVRAAQY